MMTQIVRIYIQDISKMFNRHIISYGIRKEIKTKLDTKDRKVTIQIYSLLRVWGILSSIIREWDSRTTDQYAITDTQQTLMPRITARAGVYKWLFMDGNHNSNVHPSPLCSPRYSSAKVCIA